ncbi:hypothetical protein GOBAR_AA29614 [Gossypium barbadense]|uniref:Uncharacterized protein n=1 Tax=Gossypium barbadense TaxID=3634 RepID=A0A2P5WIZ4_GOSBA|nr:hypothetical protein GOBAR_AA29614 [Gossypium barbadense]
MDTELARLTFNEEEEEVLQLQIDSGGIEEGRNFNDSFCEARMMLGVDIAKMGWDLSLRAQSRRALSMKSIWLREEGEGKWEGYGKDTRVLGVKSWRGENMGQAGKGLDPTLGLNLERGTFFGSKKRDGFWKDQMQTAMEHNSDDGILEGDERKKRQRGVMENSNENSESEARKLKNRIETMGRADPNKQKEKEKVSNGKNIVVV